MVTATYLGHSAVQLADGKTTILIDPFLRGNPVAKITPEKLNPDYIIVTHGHDDHLGDTVEIAQRTGALCIATFELGLWLETQKCKVHTMSVGGTHRFPFGRVKCTVAQHSASLGELGDRYAGVAAGVIVELDGKMFYHAGDTALTYDMKLIAEAFKVDLAFLPIGDNYTMGIDDAVRAVEFVRPQRVAPIHFNTYDMILADPDEFANKVRAQGIAEPFPWKPMDTITL